MHRVRLLVPAAVASALLVSSWSGAALGAGRSSADDYGAEAGSDDDDGNDDVKDDKPKWTVDAPPGPVRWANLDVDEGTWMSLDVHPQGDLIVFDLLGDIYTLPIAGGEATPIREGMAWDMQPRFSPDGAWIAYTSDAGGGDNIWLMRADGSEPRAVSKESFRLLNSPAWAPDGQYIVARKHFTSGRSLGAGEMWLFHRDGGDGLQMTKKSNDQKDTGEPMFSADGRYLYFSEDTTPGPYFEYNKDPHAGIYSVQRLDREDGRIETFIGGPGGACRPTPSPDGRWVAFVRRVGLKTALFVHEVTSGRERLLFDRLDRDMQETWAIHGVYPTMAWTPDATALLFWAGGKIHRVAVADGARSVIPFHVQAKRELREPVRRSARIDDGQFHTRLLRGVEVAPDGSSVVFQALGRLYLRSLAEGGLPDVSARLLTAADDVVEQHPAFSPDGRQVAYTTWHSYRLGEVRIADVATGSSRVVSAVPGHYVEPSWSPDGELLVFRRIGSDGLRAPIWEHDQGVFVVPAAGGEVTRVVRDGYGPHFGASTDRLFFVTSEGGGEERKLLLKAIDLDGSDERTVASSHWGSAMRVSPDGRYLAFQERYQVYLTTLPQTGRTIEVGPKAKSMPLTRASKDGGANLRWSGDSARLYWSHGPELFEVDLAPTFAKLADKNAPKADSKADKKTPKKTAKKSKDKDKEEPPKGIDLGIDVARDIPRGATAVVGGRVITMRGDEVIEGGTVVVVDNRITQVGHAHEVTIPEGAYRVNASGMTVIPGLIDVHYHGPQGGDDITPQENWSLYATLAFGVTTAHDPSHDTEAIFAAAELQRAGRLVGPRIYSTGTILYGATTPFTVEIDSLDDARTHLRRMQATGAFSVKSYNQPRRDQRQQVLTAARELRMLVVPEGGSLFQHNMNMVVDGHTGIEHALPIGAGYADVRQLWSSTPVAYTPTLGVAYGGVSGENYWYQHTEVFAHPLLTRYVPPGDLESRARRRMMLSDGDWNHIPVATLAKQLADAGVAVNLGAHGQREGLASHWEMWMLCQGGMTPLEAVRVATINGARYIGFDADLGSVEPGKLADLAIIDGDLLSDIRNSDRVRYTMINGRLYDTHTMDEIGNHPRVRPPLFWEPNGAAPVPRPTVR